MSDLLIHPRVLRKLCLSLFHDDLLAWLSDGSGQVGLAQAFSPFASSPIELPIKRPVRPSNPHVAQHWPEAGLWSGVYPLVCCVTQGEADFVIGNRLSQQPSRRKAAVVSKPNAPARTQFQGRVLHLPPRSFIVVPPGTPYPDGTRAHWERAQPQITAAEILWLSFLPFGAVIHLCRSEGDYHGKSWSLFVSDTRLIFLAETLIEDMQRGTSVARTSARQLLSVILLRMSDKLSEGRTIGEEGVPGTLSDLQKPQRLVQEAAPLLVKRATNYIKQHLNESLTASSIATHSYASQSHLNRIFRQELHVSIMDYVTRTRLEAACSLLETTDLRISEIGQYVGYHDPTHFSHIFMKRYATSPSEYRRQKHRRAAKKSSV